MNRNPEKAREFHLGIVNIIDRRQKCHQSADILSA